MERLTAFLIATCTALALNAPLRAQKPAGPEPPPPLDRPNVLLILSDDQSLRTEGAMQYLNSHPHGDWIRFTNAFLSTPLCCPTRATILTGRQSYRAGVTQNDGRALDDRQTLALWLQTVGYRTGFIGKYLHLVLSLKGDAYVPPGWNRWVSLVDMFYKGFRLNVDGNVVSYGPDQYQTDVLSQEAVQFIEQDTVQPWFLWVAYRAPHEPMIPAPRHRDEKVRLGFRFTANFDEGDVRDKPAWVRSLPRASRREARRDYEREYRTLLAVDEGVRTIIETLARTEQLERTVIIYMTDNGYARGEHRWEGKKCAYEECIRTPFLVRYPGTRSRTEEGFVASVDIAPTVVDLAGATPGLPQDGRSIVPLLQGEADEWLQEVFLNLRWDGHVPAWWGIRTRRWKFVDLSTGESELYDLKKDPHELRNLAGESRYRHLIVALRDKIEGYKHPDNAVTHASP